MYLCTYIHLYIHTTLYIYTSYVYITRDANSMQLTVCATIKNIAAADLFSVFLSADGNIRGSWWLN